METNKKGKNFIRDWIAAKATVSSLFVLLGLLLQNERLLVIGGVLTAMGLMGFTVMIAADGFRPTLRSFKVLFKAARADFKSVSKKIR